MNLKLTNLAKLISYGTLGILSVLSRMRVTDALGIQTKSSCLNSKYFAHWAISLGPQTYFQWNIHIFFTCEKFCIRLKLTNSGQWLLYSKWLIIHFLSLLFIIYLRVYNFLLSSKYPETVNWPVCLLNKVLFYQPPHPFVFRWLYFFTSWHSHSLSLARCNRRRKRSMMTYGTLNGTYEFSEDTQLWRIERRQYI